MNNTVNQINQIISELQDSSSIDHDVYFFGDPKEEFQSAIIGYSHEPNFSVVYDYEIVLKILIQRELSEDIIDEDETEQERYQTAHENAVAFMDYTTGYEPGNPIFVHKSN